MKYSNSPNAYINARDLEIAMVKATTYGDALSAIREAPSIDIVRCSECKYCHYEQENDVYHCYKLFHRFYDANKHFCSYGERKEDE